MSKSKLLFEDLTYKIIGAAMEVHKILGQGFLEAVYEEALAHEFNLRDIKAMKALTEVEEAQMQNYLKATGIRVGLLINFGEKSLKYKRIIR